MLTYTHDYDSDYFPSMPTVEIEVAAQGSQSVTLKAIVDSGADATMLPISVIRQLNAPLTRRSSARGTGGYSYGVQLYQLSLRIGRRTFADIEVVGDKQGNEPIVGRDILNKLKWLVTNKETNLSSGVTS